MKLRGLNADISIHAKAKKKKLIASTVIKIEEHPVLNFKFECIIIT